MRLFLVYNLLMSFRRAISTDYPLTFEFYCRDTTNFKITTPSIDSGNPDSSPPGIVYSPTLIHIFLLLFTDYPNSFPYPRNLVGHPPCLPS